MQKLKEDISTKELSQKYKISEYSYNWQDSREEKKG